MKGTSSFALVTALAPIGPARYRAAIDASWAQGRGAYGGLVAALLARAIEAEVPAGQRIARMTTAFVAPVAVGGAEIEVETVRAGRNVSTLRASVHGPEGLAATALCTASRDRDHPVSLPARPRPAAPPPDEVGDGPEELYYPAFSRRFSFRQCLGPRPFSGASEARVGGWCRLDEEAPLDAALVIAMLDAWPPAAVATSPGWCPVASLEMTVELLPFPTRPAAGWLFYEAMASRADGGTADERSALWTEDGVLLASAQQLVALFPPGPRTA